jgi:hypothetical protein
MEKGERERGRESILKFEPTNPAKEERGLRAEI